tara:strand:+ start:416 stop:640 length:225 start_codon:yes stop_codon:yes gene_type:complete
MDLIVISLDTMLIRKDLSKDRSFFWPDEDLPGRPDGAAKERRNKQANARLRLASTPKDLLFFSFVKVVSKGLPP